MFLLLGRYTRPTEDVDPHRDAHVAWVQQHGQAGHFVLGAIQSPPVGGVIVALADSRDQVDAWIAEDPFVVNEVFEYDVREYTVAFSAPGLEALAG